MPPSRPPPLQLVLDNMLPNLGLRPPKPLFVKIYELNWRPVVIALTMINTLRYALFASNSFHDAGLDLNEHAPDLALISFALSIMYILACLLEAFGLFTSLLPRPCLVHCYVYFAGLSCALVSIARIMLAVGYFALADEVVAECVSLASTGRMDDRSLFRSEAWHKQYNRPISVGEAQFQCLATWHSESVSEVVSVVLFTIVPCTICFLVAWTWGRQVRDPLHRAYLTKSHLYSGGCLCAPRSGNQSAIHVEENSPLYHPPSRGNTPGTAHSHHLTTQAPPPKQQRTVPHVRRAIPPPLLLAVPEMTQHSRPAASISENYQTVAPLALETPSPYGVSPGPPSYVPAHYSYSYTYELGDGGNADHGISNTEGAGASQQPVQRGRGEYWFA